MLPVFLINLDRSPDRLAAMTAQFDALGIPFERIAAVDGRTLPPEIAARRVEALHARPLGPGEMGCFASHRRFWSLLVERDLAAAVVIEDDVTLAPTLVEAIETIAPEIDRLGLVRLMTLERRVARDVATLGGFVVEEPIGHSRIAGTQGYVIGRAAAERLLAVSERWSLPVDNFIDKSWRHGVTIHQIRPAVLSCCVEFGSEINAMSLRWGRATIARRIAREASRTLDWLAWAGWLVRRVPPIALLRLALSGRAGAKAE